MIKEWLDVDYLETHSAISEALEDYNQSSYEGLINYIEEIKKAIRGEENLRNYLIKQKRKNAKLVEGKITRIGLLEFIKRKDKTLKKVIQQNRSSIENILEDLGL